jgi:hypothetical protein
MAPTAATGDATSATARSAGGFFRTPLVWVVVAIASALLVGGYGGYVLSKHKNGVHVLTGNAHVFYHQAAIEVGGWTYGFSGGVPMWIDASGTTHPDGGWPACLSRVGARVPIRFGETSVTLPTGISEREVVWVDCRG